MPDNEGSIKDAIGELFRLVTRRRWWVLSVAFVTSLATVAVVSVLRNHYTSEATLVVVQQQVSQKYVQPVANTSAVSAITAMTREVLSRDRLLAIINEFGIYERDKKSLSPQDLVEQMRKDIEVEPIDRIPGADDFGAFKISFTAETPYLAQIVTSRMTSLFIEENLKERGNQAARSTDFLTEQLRTAKQKMEDQAQRLQSFKSSNLDALPERQQVNLGALGDLRLQFQNTATNLSRVQQERSALESSLSGNLARLKDERTALLARYTPRHPEVVKKDPDIRGTEALLARLRTGAEIGKSEILILPDSLTGLKTQVDANVTAMENLYNEQQRVKAEIEKYQNRLSLAPMREQELDRILRDYDLYKQEYQDLLTKQSQSQLTSSL